MGVLQDPLILLIPFGIRNGQLAVGSNNSSSLDGLEPRHGMRNDKENPCGQQDDDCPAEFSWRSEEPTQEYDARQRAGSHPN